MDQTVIKSDNTINTMSKRDPVIDILKGLAILFVILGHISFTPQVFKIWIYSFHIPLFFMLSGMVFSLRYKNYGEFIVSRLRYLVLPYFTLSVSIWLLSHLKDFIISLWDPAVSVGDWNIGDFFIKVLYGYRLHHEYFSLWFICTLFVGELIFYLIMKLAEKHVIVLVISAILFLVILWRILMVSKGFYWSLDLVPACIAFLSIVMILATSGQHS